MVDVERVRKGDVPKRMTVYFVNTSEGPIINPDSRMVFFTRQGRGHPDAPMREAIKAADPAAYRSVQGGKDWKNPKVLVKPDGIEVLSQGTSHTVSPSELRRVLIDLPIEAWPYGRVVGVQRPSISSGAVGEPEAIEANLKVVRDVLAALNVDFNGWPA